MQREESAKRARLFLFLSLLGIFYLALDSFAVADMAVYLWGRDDVEEPERFSMLYVAAYGLGLVAWLTLHAHASAILRYGSYGITLITGTTLLAFAQTNARGYAITEATLFWEELEFAPGALVFFAETWVPPFLLIGAVLGLAEWALGSRMMRLEARSLVLVPIVAFLVFYWILERSDARLDQFPVPYRVAVLTSYAANHQVVWLGTRDAPYIQPAEEPLAPHIVFVVDESIRGDWLGLNGGAHDTTPFLSSSPEGLFNYGVASAIANLSSPANIIMQSGLRPDQLPDTDKRSMRNPNIFAYMKAAGFATFLVDAQHGFGRPPNFMTDADVESLDEHVLVRNTVADFEEWNADRLILPELARIIRTHERSFTYVLKIGAHFPYSVRFPPERAWFRASDLAADYEGARKAIISEYLNTIRFAVDEFASELVTTLAALERDVIVIYTADHGQSLFEPWGEDGRRIRGHGHSKDPPPYQARIPLLVLAIGEGARAAMSAHYDESLRDRASAFELFPTLLRVAGYAKTDVSEHYSHTLFDSDADRSGRVFISGNHFGADGPLYREAPYRSSFGLHAYATPTDAP